MSDFTPSEIRAAVLGQATHRFQKIAMIISKVMLNSEITLPDYAIHEVVIDMVSQGELASQGDVQKMRFSKVKLP